MPRDVVEVRFPPKLDFLFQSARYKVAYGGRGGGKSWSIAAALLIQGARDTLRIGCFREFQNSISESVHALLSDMVSRLDLGGFYEVQNTTIRGKNGTEFHFAGLRHNVTKIKSFEGLDRVWVEEADSVSKTSWETLIPTIRKEGSEIWISFNPKLETDETYQRFVVKPPTSAVVCKINWSDNPWIQPVLLAEKDELRDRDPDAYLNVWEGHCRVTLDGAIYAAELRAAQEQGRITRVPYDASKPVHTAWDLGRADMTSIWFFQVAGLGELRVIDFYENNQKTLGHYLTTLQGKGYVYGTDYMPHDADSEHFAADKSIAGQARAAGRTVRVLERSRVVLGLNTARTLFGNMYFDAEKCADGLQCLRHYRYDVDEDTGAFSREPLHDQYSHAADAFRYMALAFKEPKMKHKIVKHDYRSGGWSAA
jgi:phage terminase large subunit